VNIEPEKPIATIEKMPYGWRTKSPNMGLLSSRLPNSEVWRTTLYLKTGPDRWDAFESALSPNEEGALEAHKLILHQYLFMATE